MRHRCLHPTKIWKTMASFRSDDPARQIKERLTMDQAARRYGFQPNRAGYIRCPFHQEKTASLKIYPGDRGWHCFGCGRGGGAIDFVMQLFSLTFPQAVVRLDADFNLGLTAGCPSPGARSKILEERRAEAERARKEREEYCSAAREHRYWWEVKKYFAPSMEELGAGSEPQYHPLYVEALRLLPWLEYWLDENLTRTVR